MRSKSVGRGGVAGVDAVGQRGIGDNLVQEDRLLALVVQAHVREEQDLVDLFLGNCRAVGIPARGFGVHRMRPDVEDLAG